MDLSQVVGILALAIVSSSIGSNAASGGRYNCEQAYGQYPDSSDCSKYFSCSNYIARHVDCPLGQLFEPSLSHCAHVEHPPGCQLVQGLADEDVIVRSFECHEINGDFQDRSDCSSFWQCQNWLATRMQCPPGWLFFLDPIYENRGLCHQSSPDQHPAGCTMPYNYQW